MVAGKFFPVFFPPSYPVQTKIFIAPGSVRAMDRIMTFLVVLARALLL